MKIITIIGARPQFIKVAALSRVLRREHEEILIHTGQHYDANMSDIFFKELSIPHPDYNLGVAGGTHARMTGEMLIAIEEILLRVKPDMALVYGDTNSTLAGALAAVKLHIPVCHVEAGVRMNTLLNPEEVNRILTDRISALLMCCTETGIHNLRKEGIERGVYNLGDIMYDALLYYGEKLHPPADGEALGFDGKDAVLPREYYLLTCHREENTGDATLLEIFAAMEALAAPCVYPVHPRNKARALRLVEAYGLKNVRLLQPVGYLTSLYLVKNAKKVVTDSGGLQREAWFYDIPCVTLLEHPIWPETFEGGMNRLCITEKEAILAALEARSNPAQKGMPFGDGHAAEKITRLLTEYEKGALVCNS